MELPHLLDKAKQAAIAAAAKVLQVYHSGDFDVEQKEDQSPLTRADRMAHTAITRILNETGLPILSEEGRDIPYEERSRWPYFWMVDPLDGTKEFLNRNGDFTVNIALIHQQQPILGVVQVPVTGDLYYGAQGMGAFVERGGVKIPLPRRKPIDLAQPGLKVVASRSHLTDETKEFISKLNNPELVSRGSSLKFMMIAEGLADAYPRFGPTMEWDTAAAQGVLREVGCLVEEVDGKELLYNKANLRNPFFVCGTGVVQV